MFSSKHLFALLYVLGSGLLSFALLILTSWLADWVVAGRHREKTHISSEFSPSVTPIRGWLVFGLVLGLSTGLALYLLESLFKHHWITGYLALQVALGPFFGLSLFGTPGAIILVRKLHVRSWGILVAYVSGLVGFGPHFARIVMHALGLPVEHMTP
jgi:hypothetical protein